MVTFRYKVSLNVFSKDIVFYFRALTTKEQIDILKSILNGDESVSLNCIYEILNSCCLEKSADVSFFDLNFIQIFILLINIRLVSIGPFTEVSLQDNETLKKYSDHIDFSLVEENLIKTLKVISTSGCPIRFKLKEDVFAEFSIPKILVEDLSDIDSGDYRVMENILIKSLDCIQVGETKKTVGEMSKQEILGIYEYLDIKSLKRLETHIMGIEDRFKKIAVFTIKNPYRDDGNVTQQLTLNDTFYMEFFKLLFDGDLYSLQEILYRMISKNHFNFSDLMSMVPADRDLYVKFFEREMEDNNKSKGKKGFDLGRGEAFGEDITKSFL